MRRAFFPRPRSCSFVLYAALLYACAEPEGGPPSASGGSSNVDTGGSFSQGTAGSALGTSGAVGQSGNPGASGTLGSAGGQNTSFGGSVAMAGSGSGGAFGVAGNSSAGAPAGGSASGGSESGGTSAAGGKGNAGSSSGGGSAAGSSSVSCSVSIWSADKVYMMGDKASKNGMIYTAAYYTQTDPTQTQNCCGGGKPWASSAACN